MKCKKCKKECLESELENEICKECAEREKNNTRKTIIKTVIISVVISVFINLTIEVLANDNVSNSSFKVESFNMETEKNKYSYTTEETVYYNGSGTISCKDKNGDYIVLIEKINKTTNEKEYITTIIHNGKGEITTYDSSYYGVKEKPEYEFNIIGYRKFRTVL